MRKLFSLLISIFILFSLITISEATITKSGRFLYYDGNPIYLIGHDMQDFFADTDYSIAQVEAMIDTLATYKVNAIRVWINVWWLDPADNGLYPFSYSGGEFNLNTSTGWNSTFWDRYVTLITYAKSKGIMVEVTIFSEYPWKSSDDYWNTTYNFWLASQNNQSYFTNVSGDLYPEFFTLNYTQSGANITTIQKALITKAVNELNSIGNVFFEVANEFPGAWEDDTGVDYDTLIPWQTYMADYMKDYGVIVGVHAQEFSGMNITGVESYYGEDYVDVLNFHPYSDDDYGNENINAIGDMFGVLYTHNKVLMFPESSRFCPNADGDHTDAMTREMSASFVNGIYYLAYGCTFCVGTDTSPNYWATNEQRIETLANIKDLVSWSTMTRNPSLVTAGPGQYWEGMADVGNEYVYYFTGTRSSTAANFSYLPSGNYSYKWYDTTSWDSDGIASGTITGGTNVTVTAPSTGDWAAATGVVLVVTYTGGGETGESTCGASNCTGSGPDWTVDSTSLADVEHCVNICAEHGDTVYIPTGSATWSDPLLMSKAVSLIKLGTGTITANIDESLYYDDRYLIHLPGISSSSEQQAISQNLFRISGFTINSNNNSGFLRLENFVTDPDYIHKLRVDNNTITNAYSQYLTKGTYAGQYIVTMRISGMWKGVIDSNTITGVPNIMIDGSEFDSGESSFRYQAYSPGSDGYIYVENNTITQTDTGQGCTFSMSNFGGQSVWRYNSITSYAQNTDEPCQMHGLHGNRKGATSKAFEAYGNHYNVSSCSSNNAGCGPALVDSRGGAMLLFFNKLTTNVPNSSYSLNDACYVSPSTYTWYRHQTFIGDDIDDEWVTDYPVYGFESCPEGDSEYLYGGTNTCSPSATDTDQVPQHPWRQHMFQNFWSSSASAITGTLERAWTKKVPSRDNDADKQCDIPQPLENTHWFQDNTDFGERTASKSTGVGCGTLVARPTTCNKGVTYWVPGGGQSCGTLTSGAFGKDTATPRPVIIEGTLYRCTSQDTWAEYYTPYEYPHPYRGEDPTPDTEEPTILSFSPTTDQQCSDASEPYTQVINLGVTINEVGTCKWCLNGVGGCSDSTAYGDMANTFTTSNGYLHTSATSALACNASYTAYVRCQDDEASPNIMTVSQAIPFTILAGGTPSAPTIINLSSAKQACASKQTMAISTNVQSSCKWCESGVDGCSDSTNYTSMANYFQVTSGTIDHYEASISQDCSTSTTRYVRCLGTAGGESSTSTIVIATDAAKKITTGSLKIILGTGSLRATKIQ